MRAVRFVDHGSPLEMGRIGEDARPAGALLLRVHHCGICGSDIHQATEPQFGAKAGAVLGHEYSGEVVAIGEGVSGFAVGDRVAVVPIASCGHCAACLEGRPADCPDKRLTAGGYADLAIMPAAQCVKLPDGLSTERGAMVEPLSVGLHGLAKSGMEPGARVLIIGAGPIGMVTAYWARRFGASRLAVTASSMRKAELAKRMGADVFVAPGDATPEGVADALGGPADIVFECAGKAGLIDKGIGLIRRGGTVVGLGLTSEPDTLDTLGAMRKEARIQMAGFFTLPEFRMSALALLQDGDTISQMVTQRITLDELPTAFEGLKRRNDQCKVMVSMV